MNLFEHVECFYSFHLVGLHLLDVSMVDVNCLSVMVNHAFLPLAFGVLKLKPILGLALVMLQL
jgi:hypothetical protein